MNYFSNVSLKYPLLEEIDSLDYDFIVFSSKNDIQPQTKPLNKSPYLSIGKMVDFTSQKKLLQKQKSIDQMSSEKFMKNIDDIKIMENTMISNFSPKNSNIFTLGRPGENFSQDLEKIREIFEENEVLKGNIKSFSEEIKELKQENSNQILIMEKLREENIKCQEFCELKEREIKVLKNKYVVIYYHNFLKI